MKKQKVAIIFKWLLVRRPAGMSGAKRAKGK
jgi:hypothetical protein